MSFPDSSVWLPISGGVAAPNGFRASGISAGLKASGKPDLALIVAPEGAICAGTFTNSVVRAACIDLCIDRLKKNNGKARAVLINSGQANACTGERGLLDALDASKALASRIDVTSDEILICSTGVIGHPISMKNLISGLSPLVENLSDIDGTNAANAILTTDLTNKQLAFEVLLGHRRVRIGGMAKGSGMIHPDMATMLGFVTCDAGIPMKIWSNMVKRAVNDSFNAITVDGDTSTNDSFLAFSSGLPLDKKYFPTLELGLKMITKSLAKSIIRDGEGANCLIQVEVQGAETNLLAKIIARTICSSSLVKTAIHGSDPNWGRIAAAAGRAGVQFDYKKMSIWIGPFQLIDNGLPISFEAEMASAYMKEKINTKTKDPLEIKLLIGDGVGQAFAWGCDLSKEYIRINADYTT